LGGDLSEKKLRREQGVGYSLTKRSKRSKRKRSEGRLLGVKLCYAVKKKTKVVGKKGRDLQQFRRNEKI